MSSSLRRRSKSHGSNNNNNKNREEADEDNEERKQIIAINDGKNHNKNTNRIKAVLVSGYKRGVKTAKKAALVSPLEKIQKLNWNRGSSSSSSSSSCSGDRCGVCSISELELGGFCCCLCLSRPQTIDDDGEVVSKKKVKIRDTDNNGYEAIRVLVEKNEFFARECNTHFII